MSILNEVLLNEIKELIKQEIKKEENQVKIEDAKIIVQVLLPEIDRIVESKINKIVRKIATEVISWDLVGEKMEEPKGLNNWEFQQKTIVEDPEQL